MSKKVYISWNVPEKSWVLRFWSDEDNAYKIDSSYPVKDVDENDIGWVSELLLLRLKCLQDVGYDVVLLL